MDTRDGSGELEDPSAPVVSDDGARAPGDDGGDAGSARVFAVGSTGVAVVRVGEDEVGQRGARVGTEVSFATQVGVFSAMVLFWIATLIPAVLFGWAGFVLAVDGLAATAVLHAHGLEPRTLGPAILVGMTVAAGLLILRWNRKPPLPHLPAPWSARYPALTTIAVLSALSAVTTAAASTGSPFFPYPLATVLVVATLVFTAVISLVATVRWLVGAMRRLFQWSCGGPYRAGFVTALFLVLGGAGAWAQYSGRMAWPARWVEREMELSAVHGPTGIGDAGRKALCLAAGEIEPGEARSAAAPACSFLPGFGVDAARNECFETLMANAYPGMTRVLMRRGYSEAEAMDASSRAALVTCSKEPLPERPDAYFARVASNAALRSATRRRREEGCEDLERIAASANQFCSLGETVEIREAKLAWLRYEVTCRLTANERDIVDRRLDGMRFDEIDRELGLSRNKAKNTFNYAMDRLHKLIPTEVLEACRVE